MKSLNTEGKELAVKKIKALLKTKLDNHQIRTHVAIMLERASDNSLYHPLSDARQIFKGMASAYRCFLNVADGK